MLCITNIPLKEYTDLNVEEPGKHTQTKLTRVIFSVTDRMCMYGSNVCPLPHKKASNTGCLLLLCFEVVGRLTPQVLSTIEDVVTNDMEC